MRLPSQRDIGWHIINSYYPERDILLQLLNLLWLAIGMMVSMGYLGFSLA